MCKKKAIIFDTNFIIEQRKNLTKVIEELSDNFVVYITQASIEERLGQRQLEFEEAFSKIQSVKDLWRGYAELSISKSLGEIIEHLKAHMNDSYQSLFGKMIIPINLSSEMYSAIFQRAVLKIPPFVSEKGASDKGFKDSIIWLSLIEYFISNGEDEVVFLTNDNGFRKCAESLCEEFHQKTGKTISIKENTYVSTYKDPDDKEESEKGTKLSSQDIEQIRKDINLTFNALCEDEYIDEFGDTGHVKMFSMNKKVDDAYIESIFEMLEEKINEHLFESSMAASSVFDLDDRVTDYIPIQM